jgi:hypothetical protein
MWLGILHRTALLGVLLGATSLSHLGTAHAAGTAYAVDTAEVGEPGDCKVEGWGSWARNGDALATWSPSCIIAGMPRTELVVQTVRGGADGDWYTSVSPFMKFNLLPTAIGRPGFAVVAGPVYDAVKGDVASVFGYVPMTLRLSEVMRINVNGGWLNDRQNDRHFATYGVGWDWLFMPKFSMTLEGFGQLNGERLGWETRPRFQSGVRYRPVDAFSVDLIYGRNINGEGSHWITLSTAYRFSLK